MASFIESWIARFLFSTISAAALLWNSLVIWVIVKNRKVYLKRPFDILILNLAVADALSAVFLVFSRFLYLPTMPRDYTDAYLYCTLLWGGYILFALGYISVYTCLLLTIERWMAVVRPQAYRLFKKRQILIAVIFIWIWGFFLDAPAFLTTDADVKNKKCKFVGLRIGGKVLPFLQILLTCLIPSIVITSLYTHIFHKINRMPLFLRGAAGTGLKKRLTVISLVASLFLIVGWLPTQISYSLDLIGLINDLHRESTLYCIFIMMTLVNSVVNPVLYGVFSSRCRAEFIAVFRWVIRYSGRGNIKNVSPAE
ncbi:tachykinin-like peptides receptor 99D [Dendronephthya gigantea]|uniref:tachykinin-like peptides receptor 99D n=1 Tax=Dendronephthya gigantea TaxID=151771 RepID=UPI00106BD4C5|nr:tachykinin-like peptides receptor 99D [Dendronephthya gigantea]